MNGRRWSQWEQAYLLSQWPTQTTEQIARTLGRTSYSVISKAHALRVQGIYLPSHKRPAAWTDEEIEVLRRYWDTEPFEDTAVRVGRSVKGCELKAACTFGSILRRRWDREEREGEGTEG